MHRAYNNRGLAILTAVFLAAAVAVAAPADMAAPYMTLQAPQGAAELNPDVAPDGWFKPALGAQEPSGELDDVTWTTEAVATPHPVVYRSMGCATPDGSKFYVVGGQAPIVNNLTEYDVATGVWTARAPMPLVCANMDVVYWQDNGTGTDSSGVIRICAYTPAYVTTSHHWYAATNTWNTIPNYPGTAQTGNMCAVVGDSVFVLNRGAFYRYSIREGTWAARTAPIDATQYYGGACEYNGKCYFVGGWTNMQYLREYDPLTGTWTALASGPGVWGGNTPQVAAMQGLIIVQGGGNMWTGLNGCAAYNIVAGTWETYSALPGHTYLGAGAGAVQDAGEWGINMACGYDNSAQSRTHYRGTLPNPLNNDVGIAGITIPVGTQVDPGVPVTPRGVLTNYGLLPQSNIPVDLEIYDGATQVYTDATTYPGPLAPGASVDIDMTPWTPGTALTYDMDMYSSLVGDERPANDHAYKTVKTIDWVDIPPPVTTPDRIVHATAYDPVNDMLYMAGGNPAGQPGTYQTTFQRYDPITETWTDLAPMPTARGWIKGAYMDGKVHMIAGHSNSGVRLNTHEVYDIAGNTWTTAAPLPRATLAHLVATWDGGVNGKRIYVMGGWLEDAGLHGTTTVDVYDPVTNTWATGTPLPQNADMGDATIIGDKIYIPIALYRNDPTYNNWPNLVIGEINPSDPTQITWTTGPAHTEAKSIGPCAQAGGNVYWLGGLNSDLSTWSNKFWKYDPIANTIEETPFPYSDNIARCCFLASRTNAGEIYAFAGDKLGDWTTPNNLYKKIGLGTTSVVHDVGATAILAPVGTVMLDDVVWPEVTVENYGEVEETFNLQVTIRDEALNVVFQEVEQVVALGIGESRDITFAAYSWTATPVGNYTVTATTMLAGDVQPSNNTVGPEDFVVTDALHDVGATAVLTPAGAEFLDDVLWPEVTVENFGEAVETFMVEVVIEDEALNVVFQEEEQVVALGVGESRDFTFSTYSWTATPVGNYTVTATTMLVGDANSANDVYGPEDFTVTEAAPWPERWTETSSHIPTANSGRNVKRGGWLALGPDGNFYLAKGYKTGDFYRYDPMGDSFSILPDIEMGSEGKLPEKGCRGISDGVNSIYMTKGNNTLGFWHYDITAKTWAPLTDVPAGATGKKVKGGTDLIYYNPPDDTGYVYMLKGYKTEFWRYNTGTGMWEARANAPTGIKDKWDKGSWLAFDGENTIYAHKAKYYTGSEHEFYRYNIERDSWSTALNGMPLYGMHSGRANKKKKAKDGGAGAYYADGGEAGQVYALKGGNTQQFFMYDVAADTWTEKDTIPTNGSTGKKRRVKVGGDFVYWGRNAFFAMKGNKTQEMWRYVIPAMPMRADRGGVMAGTVKGLRTGMTVGPNPVVGGFATLRYSLPKAGPADIHVFDVTGRNVLSRSVLATRSGAVSLDLRSMSAGIYLVRVEADGFTGTQKLVIQH